MQDLEDLALLTELAEAAGHIALRYFRRDPHSWDKGEGMGPVSEADLEINDMLLARVRAERPGYAILSEEEEEDPARATARDIFVADPIDGTRAFLEGNPAFAHSLAIVRDGVVCAAVVSLPAKELVYAAAAGHGARLNGTPIAARAEARLPGAEILANRSTLEPEHWPGAVPDVTRVYRPSLAYRICLVAEGRFDGMITLRDAWEWDTAAGVLIAQEAGARVSDALGRPIRFNSAGARHPGCIVAPPALHEALIALRHAA